MNQKWNKNVNHPFIYLAMYQKTNTGIQCFLLFFSSLSGGDKKPPKTLEFSIFLFFISPVKKKKAVWASTLEHTCCYILISWKWRIFFFEKIHFMCQNPFFLSFFLFFSFCQSNKDSPPRKLTRHKLDVLLFLLLF